VSEIDDKARVDRYLETHFGVTPEGKPAAEDTGLEDAEKAMIDRYVKPTSRGTPTGMSGLLSRQRAPGLAGCARPGWSWRGWGWRATRFRHGKAGRCLP